MRAARDAAIAQLNQLSASLEAAERRNQELALQRECLERTADLAHAAMEAAQHECDELRKLLQAQDRHHAETLAKLTAASAATFCPGEPSATEERLSAELKDSRDKLLALDAFINQLQQEHREASATLTDRLVKAERDRRLSQDEADRLRTLLQDQTAELARLRNNAEDTRSQTGSSQAELTGLQRQIDELNAELSAARDELRVAWALAEGWQGAGGPEQAADISPATSKPLTKRATTPLTGADAQRALGRMRGTLGKAAETSVEALDVLERQLKDFGQLAAAAGSLATSRIMAMCVEVVQWMRKTPGRMDVMREPLLDAFNLVSTIAATSDQNVHADTADASVYVVDDDVDNCECIAVALSKHGFRTQYAPKARLAVEHLAIQPCDIIILDADLPGASGQELHARIRDLSHHGATPLLLLGAVQPASLGPRDTWLAKPYSVSALGLKALHLLVASRLEDKRGLRLPSPITSSLATS